MSFRFDRSGFSNPTQLIIGLFVLVLFFMGIFWLARSIFRILAFLAPFMLIAAAIINYRVIFDYVRTIIGWLKTNTVFGILAIVLSVLGFPFVSLFLLLRAYSSKYGSGKQSGNKEGSVKRGEYIKYEEIDRPDLDLPDREEERLRR